MLPGSGFELFVILFTTLISTWLLWGAFREKNVPRILMGVGFAIPSFGAGNLNYWLAGAAVFAGGVWLKRYIDEG